MSVPPAASGFLICNCAPSAGYLTKLALERVVAVVLLVTFLPLLAILALLIKLDSPGPAFFRQSRYGMGNVPFEILKFRTMRVEGCDPSGRLQTADADARITRFGWFLRVTSLDELPQLVNVIRGDMALIGPRAMPSSMTIDGIPCEAAVPSYPLRHRVKPGITGLAQVSGSRGPVTSVEGLRHRTELDNRYIDEWSPGLDLWVLVRTVGVVLRGTGG